MEQILPAAFLALVIVAVLTPGVAWLARRVGAVDAPGGRRVHARITPRMGGLAVILGFFAVFWLLLPELEPNFKAKQLLGFALASLILLVAGLIDDKRGLPAWVQLMTHVGAGLTLVVVGMGIEEITNPFGGKLALDQLQIPFNLSGVEYHLTLPADLLTVAWVVLVINAINWLDGLDGLATGVGIISAFTIALLSLSAGVNQPHVALLAMILVGALGGFLLHNFHPAKVFLGTAGSTFIGFAIATLGIISGGKIATAVLVLGFPILDAMTIIIRRGLTSKAIWEADTTHLHHLLLARGFSVREAVLFIYGVSATFGGLALVAGTTSGKVVAFVALALLMVGVLTWLARPARAPASAGRRPASKARR